MTAAFEVGAIRWVVATPVEPAEELWLETSSSHEIPATFSREPAMIAVTRKPGELELFPV